MHLYACECMVHRFFNTRIKKNSKSLLIKISQTPSFYTTLESLGNSLWDKGHLTTYERTRELEVGLTYLWDKGHLTTCMCKLTRVYK